jgi:hypothetical protein
MGQSSVSIRPMTADSIPCIAAAFAGLGWTKPASQYERCLIEQAQGEREVFVAWQQESY